MKILKIILAFLIFTVGFSCENKELALTNIAFINCSECSIEEPLNATVKLKLVDPFKFGEASPVIQIDIYEGNIDDEVLFKSIQTTSTETSINLPVNKKYSFAAIYFIQGNTYVVVNSATPGIKYTDSMCDEPCYYTVPRSVNLVLKYTK